MKLTLCFLLLQTLFANLVHAETNEKILGLVEIPKIFGKAKNPSSVVLVNKPEANAKTVVQIMNSDDILSREHDYEARSAVVFGRNNQWYLIKTKTAKGWLSPRDAGKFHSYENLLKKHMAYLSGHWNNRLYFFPGDQTKFDQILSPSEAAYKEASTTPVNILNSKTVSGQLWLQVQIVENQCLGNETLGKKGWVPAYNERVETNFWFNSRGC